MSEKRARVLIVADESEANGLRASLSLSFDVDVTHDAASAETLALALIPDFVFVAWVAAREGPAAAELCARLRAAPELEGAAVFALIADGSEAARAEAYAAGALACLPRSANVSNEALALAQAHTARARAFARTRAERDDWIERARIRTDQAKRAQASAEIGRAASEMLHNLNNALTIASMHLEAARLKRGDEQAVARCKESFARVLEIVEATMAKLRPTAPSRACEMDLSEVFEAEIEAAIDAPGVRGSIATMRNMRRLPSVRGVRSDFAQAFANLVRNAIEAMASAAEKKLAAETFYDARFVHARLIDSGCGIAPERLERLFERPFTTKTAEDGREGNGIGLASIRRTIAQYGGAVRFESAVGEGTVVTISVPRSDAGAANGADAAPADGAASLVRGSSAGAAARAAAQKSVRGLGEAPFVEGPALREFDELAMVAAAVCDAPMASIALFSAGERRLAAAVGCALSESDKQVKLIGWERELAAPLVVEDVERDYRFRRFKGDPLVDRSAARFFASVPLVSREGSVIGALTAMDELPREIGGRKVRCLQVIAARIVQRLEELKGKPPQASDKAPDKAA